MKANYQRPVNLTPELEAAWQAYKAQHPAESFSGLVKRLLTEALCVPAAPTTIIP